MRKFRAALVSLCAACTAHAPVSKLAATPLAQDATVPAAMQHEPQPPASPDVSHELMGWVVLGDGARLVDVIARVTGVDVGSDPEAATRVMVSEIGGVDPRLLELLDLRRPAAVALLNPSLLKGAAAQPFLALVPVRDRATVERTLLRTHQAFVTLPWGLVVATPLGRAFVAFDGKGYARVAWRPELVAAAGTILDAAVHQPAAPLVVHVNVENVHAWYGPQMESLLSQISSGGGSSGGGQGRPEPRASDPQLTFATRTARELVRLSGSVRALDLLVGSDGQGLTVTARVDGQPEGSWAGYVASQQAGDGAPWGAHLLPEDSVLVYATRRSGGSAQSELAAAVDLLADTAGAPVSPAERAAWRGALDRAATEMSGELIYAVWPGRSGGMGLGGAYRVRSVDGARRQIRAAYRRVGARMAGIAARALELDPARYQVRVDVREGALLVGQTPVDTVEVSVRWPAHAGAERRRFEALFGDKLVLATAFRGDAGMFALGRDWRPRLEALLAAALPAEGREHAPTLADNPEFARSARFHSDGRVSFTWLPTGRMTRLLGELLVLGGPHGPTGAELASLVTLAATPDAASPPSDASAATDSAIVSATNASGTRYEISTRLPTEAIPELLQVNGALWRIALAPLVNPPAFPPLPLPPAHVTPHMPGIRLDAMIPRVTGQR